MKKTLSVLLVGLLFAGCTADAPHPATTSTVEPTQTAPLSQTSTEPITEPLSETTEPTDPVLLFMDTMTLEEKVAQLFIIRPENIGATDSAELMTPELLERYPVAGFMLANQNIRSESQVTSFCNAMKAGRIPAFVSVDEEGGTISRFANHSAFNLPKYKSAEAVGSSGKPEDAFEMGDTIGQYLNRYGINMDFAPVADVNTNPDNPIIGNRAFSSDPVVADKMARAMAQGLQQNNVIPVYKHFPGHGDTAEDSHSKLAVSYKSLEQLETCEWLPYQALESDVCVMIAHVALPKVTGNMTPATLSEEVIQNYLRQKLGFAGVIMTDGMEMGAITDTYSPGEAAVLAIRSGCDMILLPLRFEEAYTAVLEAVKDGTLSEERINESIYRILTLKNTYGLLNLE